MTPRGEAPKNSAGANALGSVGIGPKKPHYPPNKAPPQQGFPFFFLFFFLFLSASMLGTLCDEGPTPCETRQRHY
jgi:hypothetical protein